MSETLLTRFRFSVQIDPSGQGGDEGLTGGDGAFSEVSGLEMSIEMTTFREGGYHAGSRQLAGTRRLRGQRRPTRAALEDLRGHARHVGHHSVPVKRLGAARTARQRLHPAQTLCRERPAGGL